MAQNYKTGLIITGDASGGIRAIKATDDELGKLNKGFDKGSRQSKKFGADAERAGRQLTEIDRGAGVATRGLETLRRAAAPIAGAIAGMFAANTIQNQVDWGDQLQKTNLRIGASTESLSQYNYVAKLSGVEFGQLTTAWQRQTRRIAEAAAGTGVASKALDRLGLSAKDLNQLAPEEQFERIATAMQNVESSSERVALAQKLWDSEGVKLVQIVNQGTDAIAAMRAEADALGLTISQDTANAMASYNDEVDRLKFAAQGLSQTLAGELVPSMTAGLQATSAFIQQVGGADAILETAADAATMFAVVMGGRLVGALTKSTQGMISDAAAAVAQANAHATATTAARAKAAETLRVAQADQAAATRALANGHAIAAATGNTTLRTKAITQMAAANQRAIAAETAHTAAVNVNSAAMARGTVAAQGMAAATRTGASALALIGGPAGAALIAGAGLYYFREELGLTDDKMQGTIGTIESLGDSFVTEFGNIGAELMGGFRGIRGGLIDIDASFIDLKASAVGSFAGIVASSADVINLGLIPIQHALNALDQGFANWINRTANAFESAGDMPFGMANLFGEQVSRMRNMADDLTEGMIEPIGISTAALDNNVQAWRDQADAMRNTADAVRNGTNPAAQETVAVFKTLDEWLLKTTESTDENTGSNVASAAAAREAAESTAAQAKALEDLYNRLRPGRRETIQMARDVGTLNLAMATGTGNIARHAQGMQLLALEYLNAQDKTKDLATDSEDASQRIANSFTSWGTIADNTLRSVDDSGRDAWLGLVDGSTSALDTVENAFEQTFANIAHMLTTQKLTFEVAGMMGLDTTGMQGGGSGMSLQNINPGMLKSGWDTASGWFSGGSSAGGLYSNVGAAQAGTLYGSASTGAAQGGLYGNAATGGLASTSYGAPSWAGGGTASGLAGGLYTAGAGFAGGWAGNQVFGGGGDSDTGAAIGTAAGAAIGSVIPVIGTYFGAAIGSFLGSGIGSMFGNETEFKGRFGTTGTADPSQYASSGKDGVFEHQDDGTNFYGQSALGYTGFLDSGTERLQRAGVGEDKGWAEELTAASVEMDNLVASIANSPEELEAMRAAVQGLETSSSNAGQIIEFALNERPRAALEALGGEFGRFVQGLSGSIEEVVQQAQVAQQAHSLLSENMARLNLQFDAGGAGAYEAASSMAEYAGGVDQLAAINDAYYQAAFSEQERLQHTYDDVRGALGGLTDEAPRTVEELRALVEAQQLNGEAGGKLAVDLMALAPALKDANAGVRQAIEEQYQESMGRAPESAGMDYWFDVVASGSLSLTDALKTIAGSAEAAEFAAGGAADAIDGASGSLKDLEAVAREREQLERQLLQLQGDNTALRKLDLATVDPANHALQRHIWAMQDQAAAASEAEQAMAQAANERMGLERQMLQAMGDTAALRAMDLAQIDPSNRALQQRVWAIEDEKAAAQDAQSELNRVQQALESSSYSSDHLSDSLSDLRSQLGSAQSAAQSAWDRYRNQSLEIEIGLLELLGDESAIVALQRERELEGIDESLRPMQERLWALEDETNAVIGASDAVANYVGALGQASDFLDGAFGNIQQWRDDLDATSQAPVLNLEAASDQFARQLALAENGDRDALQSITRYADQFLQAGQEYYASGDDYTQIKNSITDALEQLPDAVSAEQFLADEIRDALQSVVIAQMPTDATLTSALENKLSELGSNQMTLDQMRTALAPIATDSEIARLINQVDANGDGIITEQELANAKLSGLAVGIGQSLKPMFDGIDLNTDGLIDWKEFHGAFKGLASDKKLQEIYRQLDVNGDGQISELEAIKAYTGHTDENTLPIEERAQDQLEELGGLNSSMTGLADGMVNLSGNIGGLVSAIAQLADIQAEEIRQSQIAGAVNSFSNSAIGSMNRALEGRVNDYSNSPSAQEEYGSLGNYLSVYTGRFPLSVSSRTVESWDGVIPGSIDEEWLKDNPDFKLDTANRMGDPRYVHVPTFQDALEEWERISGNSYSGPRFAKGGVFTNSIVSTPTYFDMGLMGEEDPEAIVPLSRGAGGRLGIDASGLMRMPDGPLHLPMPEVPPLPDFPALGNSDVLQVLKDVKKELQDSRKETQKANAEKARLLELIGDLMDAHGQRSEQLGADQLEELESINRNSKTRSATV